MLKKIIYFIVNWISFFITSFIPVKKDLVIFTGTSLSNYNENSRYLYEYLVKNKKFSPMWVTNSKKVYDYLCDKKYPVMWHKSLSGAWCYMRAGVVIGTGLSYPSLFMFVGKRTKKIWLSHGAGIRGTNAVSSEFINQFQLLKKFHAFDFLIFTSKFMDTYQGKLQFLIPKNKRKILGFPRCDHLFNLALLENSKNNKSTVKNFNMPIKENTRVLLYAPTWRPEECESDSFSLFQLSEFNYSNFNNWLKHNNIVLLISVHASARETYKDLSSYGNIDFIPDDPLIDINQIITEVDLLITDYSSIATDFMLMNRPVIFVMLDYDYFYNDYGLLEDIRLTLPGVEVDNINSLELSIIDLLNNPEKFQQKRDKYLEKYYDINNTNACSNISNFIENLI